MILIASGAYLQEEFSGEVGLLPPSFLPIGNQRLYEYQIQFLKYSCSRNDDIYLSVPDSYSLDTFDVNRLDELGVRIIKVPDDLSLGDSVLYCWNATAKHYDDLTLLHGDTLFLNADFESENAVSVHTNRGFYKRANLGQQSAQLESIRNDWSNDCDQVISGFFRFQHPLFFMKSLVEAKSNFVEAIVSYHKAYPVMLVSGGDWLDFGHINSFYQSRTRITTQRAFNDLKIDARSVTKASIGNPKKIYAEGLWFSKLPLSLRIYTPALLNLDSGSEEYKGATYQLEYLYLLPLSDLFVFSRLAKGSWQSIFQGICQTLNDFASFPSPSRQLKASEFDALYLTKTLDRLYEYEAQTGFDVSSQNISFFTQSAHFTLVEIVEYSTKYIQRTNDSDLAISHGDFCFSNLLFDSRVETIKCIDPRGITPKGELSLYGDKRYDYSKLYHSVIGLYDLIIAGHYKLKIDSKKECIRYDLSFSKNGELYAGIVDSFRDVVLKNCPYSEKEMLAITIHLFLSMLPLHNDRPDRQNAFIANALRLHNLLREMDS